MAQIFHPSTNTLSRLSIYGALVILLALGFITAEINRSPYVTGVGIAPEQPVPFSHQHHAAGLGLDCRYCHTSVESSSFAGIPPTKTCMNCHSQIWTNAPLLEPVRASWRDDKSLMWTRVHNLPDFVYFNHSIHLNKGVGCASCHGPVDTMPLTYQAKSLQMEWCLECHREPEKYLRPRDKVFDMQYQPPTISSPVKVVMSGGVEKEFTSQMELGSALHKEYNVRSYHAMIGCDTCHR